MSTSRSRPNAETDAKRPAARAPRQPRKLSEASLQARAERAARTREEFLMAAAKVVGETGYRDASIQRITAACGVALGTFYLYFPSRQALFDTLLPHFGLQMLDYVRERIGNEERFFEAEEIGFRAVFEYLSDNPWFWRLLNEAEVEAPTAWARHHAAVHERYIHFLKRMKARGELRQYAKSELPTLADLLIAARDYVYRTHLTTASKGARTVPNATVRTYRRFIESGLANPAA
ncbi:MAG: TetR/AcrR family transcriptional regulator [Hydrogenophaga sp.]|uniref:TetR/AcrR family transcriptional regulator n=1 Tax=Hydrogenophaga crocea TaxID=2716225 RepID=A0A6G8ID97_9BURK|nr:MULTISPECIES: TetR/AcrR family transcriptional regulator [Hydrogenophaga]MBL0942864.1 TetR/AcrR family transcriptional regulator [Hydrogenophaga sp.]QIM51157.1 TetR/AcrR family transcriptional regulator [Hydrogenophaga crocea]